MTFVQPAHPALFLKRTFENVFKRAAFVFMLVLLLGIFHAWKLNFAEYADFSMGLWVMQEMY